MGVIEVLSLGSGNDLVGLAPGVGAATSFVVLIDGTPSILIGLGPGSLKALHAYLGCVPDTIIILSGDWEQTAEIPLLIQTEVVQKGRRLNLFGASPRAVEVSNSLIRLYYPTFWPMEGEPGHSHSSNDGDQFRLLSGRERGDFSPLGVSSFVAASSCGLGCTLAQGTPQTLCGSIKILFRDRPVVSFTGPAGELSADTMEWLSEAPTVVCWTTPVTAVGCEKGRLPLLRVLQWFATHHHTTSTCNSEGIGEIMRNGGGADGENTSGFVSPAPSSLFYPNIGGSRMEGLYRFSRAAPLRAHCVLCGWGLPVDEPVATSLPPFVSLAPQGTLLTVLMGDFVQSTALSAAQSLRALAALEEQHATSRLNKEGARERAAKKERFLTREREKERAGIAASYATPESQSLHATGLRTPLPFSTAPTPTSNALSSHTLNAGEGSRFSSPLRSGPITEGAFNTTTKGKGGGGPLPPTGGQIDADGEAINGNQSSAAKVSMRSEHTTPQISPIMSPSREDAIWGDGGWSSRGQHQPGTEPSSGWASAGGTNSSVTIAARGDEGRGRERRAGERVTAGGLGQMTSGKAPRLHTSMASVSSSAALSASTAPINGTSRMGYVDTRKVRVYNNDNKGHEGKLFMMKNFRQLPKFAEAVAQQLGVMPLSCLVFADGKRVTSLDEIPPDGHIVAVRRGGAPFDPRDLPRGMAALFV